MRAWTLLGDRSPPFELLRRLADHATPLTPGRSDQRLHPTPEGVPHQPLPRDRLVQSLQLEKGERLVQQLSRIRGDQITRAKLIDGQPDDLGVVVAQISRAFYRDELHRDQLTTQPATARPRTTWNTTGSEAGRFSTPAAQKQRTTHTDPLTNADRWIEA